MFPSTVSYRLIDCTDRYPIFLGESWSFSPLPANVIGSYIQDCILSKLTHWMKITAIIPNKMPTLFSRINHIIFICSKEKMVGSNTWRVIAFVANLKSIWYLSKVNYPRSTMGTDISLSMLDAPISVIPIVTAIPKPASIRLADKTPKSFSQWLSSFWMGLIASLAAKLTSRIGLRGELGLANHTYAHIRGIITP